MELASVRALLRTDPGWSVYALADLAPPYREHSEWRLKGGALLLVYRGFDPPVLFAMGDVSPLLLQVSGEPAFYLSVRPAVPDGLRALGYEVRGEKTMLRMVLDPGRFAPPPDGNVVRLGPADEREIRELFAPPFFDASMLRHGLYFGVRERRELMAVAGTHVLAIEEGVAALGNVYTRADRRGRGLGRRTTAAVAGELLRLGVPTIALNVEAGNRAAIRVYERLGFITHCEYREALAFRMLQS